jgi:protease I
MKKVLVVIAQEGYQDVELEGTRKALEAAGYTAVLCSKEAGTCTGKFGGSEHALLAMKDVDVGDYNRVVFIGGPGAAELASDGYALNIAYKTVEMGLPLGAICVAPLILAKAKVLDGRKATVWHSDENVEVLHRSGAMYTGEDVTVDGKIVTANGPDAAEEFGRTIASGSLGAQGT